MYLTRNKNYDSAEGVGDSLWLYNNILLNLLRKHFYITVGKAQVQLRK